MAQIKVNAMSQALVIKALLEGPSSLRELAEVSGLHYVTVREYMSAMHKAKAAHISGWEKDMRGRDNIKVYSLGSGKDRLRERMTQAQRAQRYRDKKYGLAVLHAMAGSAP